MLMLGLTGVSNDLEGATEIAYTMVTKFGMSDVVCHVVANTCNIFIIIFC